MLDVINIRREQRLWFLFISGIILVVFAGFRYNSPDWMPYKVAFDEISRVGFDYSKFEYSSFFEPLYNFVVYVITLFTVDPIYLFFIVASIAVCLNLSFYQRYSKYFLLAVLLYFVHTYLLRETMQIRAGVAAGIVLWSYKYAFERKFWKFLLLIVIAMGFHVASGVALLLYVIYGLNWSNKTWIKILTVCFIIGIIFPFGKLLNSLPGGGVFDRILVYSWMVEQKSSAGILTNPTIVKQLFFCIIGLKYWDVLQEKMPYFKMLFIPVLLSACWLMVWNDFAIIAGRMGTFFSITEVMVVPMLMYLVTQKTRIIIGLFIILYSLLTLSLNVMVENIQPYQFILTR